MSLPSVPEPKKRSRFRRWRERRKYGEELEFKDVHKLVRLNRLLRSDGIKLGIPQINIEIIPKEHEGLATAAQQEYRIKNDGTLNMPSAISYDYRMIRDLSIEELRSIAWHELGHYIFSYYFPDIDNKYYDDFDAYMVTEAFADEVAFKRFGDVYLEASKKIFKFIKEKDKSADKERVEDIKRMGRYRKRYNKPYWLALAKRLKMKVELKPENRAIVGIKPRKEVLKGLYGSE